jgi:hypothetical protein
MIVTNNNIIISYNGSIIDYTTSIVLNGLVLYLDAGNPLSYPGTGTVWTDLSNFGNNGTLTNGPTFNSGNGGSIVFDGSNDFVNISTSISTLFSNSTNNITYSFWIRPTINQSNNSLRILFNVAGTGFNGGRVLLINRLISGQYNLYGGLFTTSPNISFTEGNISNPQNTWINPVFIWDGLKYSIFLNGLELSYTTQQSFSTGYSTNSTPIRLGADTNIQNPPFAGQISIFQLYNRVLTSTEVLQNYNAQKSRFGL